MTHRFASAPRAVTPVVPLLIRAVMVTAPYAAVVLVVLPAVTPYSPRNHRAGVSATVVSASVWPEMERPPAVRLTVPNRPNVSASVTFVMGCATTLDFSARISLVAAPWLIVSPVVMLALAVSLRNHEVVSDDLIPPALTVRPLSTTSAPPDGPAIPVVVKRARPPATPALYVQTWRLPVLSAPARTALRSTILLTTAALS